MLAVSKKVSLIECRNRPLWYKVCGKLLRLISPLM
jgi:cardiolipin synthase